MGIHCEHCGHEGYSAIERQGPGHYIIAIGIIIVGLFSHWAVIGVGALWLIVALNDKGDEVCPRCNSKDVTSAGS